ncbi:MAG: permease [Patescibacteria group bacterium]
MTFFYILTVVAIGLSLMIDRGKSWQALRIALKRFLHILPDLLMMIVLVSVVLLLVPERTIARYLGTHNIYLSAALAAILGSVTLMPGFIAYPLCGLLLEKGVPYLVLGIFSTTLMMVGVVTFPLEQHYFGTRVALIRNLLSLLIALIVGICIGIFYGEI